MLTATLYVVMHFLYAYADMSWDNQSMVYMGAMLGIINAVDYATRPAPAAVTKKKEMYESRVAIVSQ